MDLWTDEKFAADWDAAPERNNPARARHLGVLLALVEKCTAPGDTLLDLGTGGGLVARAILDRFPDRKVIGVDFSRPMLDLAARRLGDVGSRFIPLHHDLRLLASATTLPRQAFRFVFASQSLHELPHDDQRAVFRAVRALCASDGVFVMSDRLRMDLEQFSPAYDAVWSTYYQTDLRSYLSELGKKNDHPASLGELLEWLSVAGFSATCLDQCFNRALVYARILD